MYDPIRLSGMEDGPAGGSRDWSADECGELLCICGESNPAVSDVVEHEVGETL